MINYQQSIVELLQEDNVELLKRDTVLLWQTLSPEQCARFLVDISFLLTALQFSQEQFWIHTQKKPEQTSFGNFIKKFFKKELTPILFLHSYLENADIKAIDSMRTRAKILQNVLLENLSFVEQEIRFIFASTCVKYMSDLFEFEYQLKMNNEDAINAPDFLLDRTFDILDDVLKIDYSEEEKSVPENDERLYVGSGLGVQSSYSTILLALRYLRLPKNFRIVDLGSGFGRVGLAAGLMRVDVQFSGYEFVENRVQIANRAADNLGFGDRVHFYQQDLSLIDFQIPEAEVYYLYDPFTEPTYSHVIAQLSLIGFKKQITIVAKGNARKALENFTGKSPWQKPQLFPHGNFSLFRTRGS